jgi:hypothetical protein
VSTLYIHLNTEFTAKEDKRPLSGLHWCLQASIAESGVVDRILKNVTPFQRGNFFGVKTETDKATSDRSGSLGLDRATRRTVPTSLGFRTGACPEMPMGRPRLSAAIKRFLLSRHCQSILFPSVSIYI